MGSFEKELVCLRLTPFIPGAEAAVVSDAKRFAEADISNIVIDDPWLGIVELTLEAYVGATYTAYTAAAPPAAERIMFNADRTAFKCGSPLWWGKVMAYIIPVGSKVLVS